MEKKIKIGLIVLIVGIVLISGWWIWNNQMIKLSESETTKTPPLNILKEPKLQSITSHSEAIKCANDYLNTTLGNNFVKKYFEVLRVDERPDIPSIWLILYKYRSNDHYINLSLVVDVSNHPSTPSRVDAEFSGMIKTPQEIKLSPSDAEAIAAKNNSTPPYSTMLWLSKTGSKKPKRLSWSVVSTEIKEFCKLNGYVIDAENGEILRESRYRCP